jgi:hypothetical protein
MERQLFKVFGLQRSGTNLAQHMVETNFLAQCLDEASTGWKHGPVRLPGGTLRNHPVYFVLCVKNPYAWAVSCYRYFQQSFGMDPTMPPQFIADPRMSFERFVRSPHYAFESPVHRWNVMHRLWLSTLPAGRTMVVRQEDQFDNQQVFLETIEARFGFARRESRLALIERRVDVDRAILGQMNSNYYRHKEFLRDYTADSLAWMNSVIDGELMDRFAYVLESSPI